MSDDGRWQDCPPGLVTGMVDELRRQQRASSVRPVIGAFVVAVLLGAGYALTSGLLSDSSGPLRCSDVIPLLAQYDKGTLSAPVTQKVEEHLSHCPSCQERYESSFSDEAHRAVRLDPVVAVLVLWR